MASACSIPFLNAVSATRNGWCSEIASHTRSMINWIRLDSTFSMRRRCEGWSILVHGRREISRIRWSFRAGCGRGKSASAAADAYTLPGRTRGYTPSGPLAIAGTASKATARPPPRREPQARSEWWGVRGRRELFGNRRFRKPVGAGTAALRRQMDGSRKVPSGGLQERGLGRGSSPR